MVEGVLERRELRARRRCVSLVDKRFQMPHLFCKIGQPHIVELGFQAVERCGKRLPFAVFVQLRQGRDLLRDLLFKYRDEADDQSVVAAHQVLEQ